MAPRLDATTLAPVIPGSRTERDPDPGTWLDRWAHRAAGALPRGGLRLTRARLCIHRVNTQAAALAALDDAALDATVRGLRHALRRHGLRDALVVRSLAIVREIAARRLGTRPFDCQVMAAWLLLQGSVTEMATGEGKTLTAVLAAATAALAGLPTHVLSVNDYLTARDAEAMQAFYEALKLDVGIVVHGCDTQARRRAYGADVVYCTGKEIVFDYLRDRLVLGTRRLPLQARVEPLFGATGCGDRLLLRGLYFAIVDEADSVLIDEARTPLIISGVGGSQHEEAFMREALALARTFDDDRDFVHEIGRHEVRLTAAGEERARIETASHGPLWAGQVRRNAIVTQALAALHAYQRDIDYVLRDGTVEIVDPLTGRVSAGRAWERGLHQLIELKEGCPPSRQRATLARMSYPDFFRRYVLLSGMTGTAREVRGELWRVYGLPFVRVPVNRPCRRRRDRTGIFADSDARWKAVAARAAEVVGSGRAVLVGTTSVAASERAAEIFRGRGLDFRVLNARQDGDEAAIVALAGQPGRITIATSMAGRGTDIKLHEEVARYGGLHVIMTEHYDAARIDRQLAGRCARQGDPGSCQVMVSLDDTVFESRVAAALARAAVILGSQSLGFPFALAALRFEQWRRERRAAREREATRRQARGEVDLLAVSGRGD